MSPWRNDELDADALEAIERAIAEFLEPIPDDWPKPCQHPEHLPPTHVWIPPGYQLRHVCPRCLNEIVVGNPVATFTV